MLLMGMPLQVQEQTSVTAGGLMLPDTARERPMSGQIVRVGPGKRDKDGTRKAPKVELIAANAYLSSYV